MTGQIPLLSYFDFATRPPTDIEGEQDLVNKNKAFCTCLKKLIPF